MGNDSEPENSSQRSGVVTYNPLGIFNPYPTPKNLIEVRIDNTPSIGGLYNGGSLGIAEGLKEAGNIIGEIPGAIENLPSNAVKRVPRITAQKTYLYYGEYGKSAIKGHRIRFDTTYTYEPK